VTFRAGARSTAAGVLIGLTLAVLLVGTVVAASPSPSPAVGNDPRSSGQGPGLVGDPATAILLVLGIGLVAVVGTLAYIKLTGGRRS
jgi:hypothetical protein